MIAYKLYRSESEQETTAIALCDCCLENKISKGWLAIDWEKSNDWACEVCNKKD
jgi:hypothetical protein